MYPEEGVTPPKYYYNKQSATKYKQSSHYNKIQQKLFTEAVEILTDCNFTDLEIILDLGIGCFSYGNLVQNDILYVGIDISMNMLEEIEEDCEKIRADIGNLSFLKEDEIFDAVISISAVQWLFFAYSRQENVRTRLSQLFKKTITVSPVGIFQFYLYNKKIEVLLKSILKKYNYNILKVKKYYYLIIGRDSICFDKYANKIIM